MTSVSSVLYHTLALLHVWLPVHDEHLLVGQQKVPIVVAEVIGIALPGAVEVGEVAEVEAGQLQHLAAQGSLALRAGLFEKSAVFP